MSQIFGDIIQIVPATDCFAVLVDKDGNEWAREPVLCWALTNQAKVCGLVTDGGSLTMAEKRKDFGYYDPRGAKYKRPKLRASK